ncbi:hypothetical protein Trydic_g12854 [Trypoxylus dichotomus]
MLKKTCDDVFLRSEFGTFAENISRKRRPETADGAFVGVERGKLAVLAETFDFSPPRRAPSIKTRTGNDEARCYSCYVVRRYDSCSDSSWGS